MVRPGGSGGCGGSGRRPSPDLRTTYHDKRHRTERFCPLTANDQVIRRTGTPPGGLAYGRSVWHSRRDPAAQRGVEMSGGRSTTDPFAAYPPGSGAHRHPAPAAQGVPTPTAPADDASLVDDVLDLAGFERRDSARAHFSPPLSPPPPPSPAAPTDPTLMRHPVVEDDPRGRLVMLDLSGSAPGPVHPPDHAQVRVLGGEPPPRTRRGGPRRPDTRDRLAPTVDQARAPL